MRELFLLCPPPPPPPQSPPPEEEEEEEEEMRARFSVAALVEVWGEGGRIDDDEHLSRHPILSVYLRREKKKKITNRFCSRPPTKSGGKRQTSMDDKGERPWRSVQDSPPWH